MEAELKQSCEDLLERIGHLKTSLDLDGQQNRLTEINQKMAAPGFWDDSERARKTTTELSSLNASIKPLAALVTCPWHGWQYDVETGLHCLTPQICQQSFDIEIDGDDVLVDIP